MQSGHEEETELEEEISQANVNTIEINPYLQYFSLSKFLDTGIPPEGLDPKKKRSLSLKVEYYNLIQGVLFRSNQEGVLLQ